MALGSDTNRIGEEHYTESSPNYPLLSREAFTAIGVAAGLIAATLGLMWAMVDTAFASGTIWLFQDAPLAPFVGAIVFGIFLTAGRYFGVQSSVNEQYGIAFLASAVVAVAYAAFGAGVLSLYAPTIHADALLWTAVLTTAFTILAGAVVYTTDYSFANWGVYSGVFMMGGLLFLFIYSLVPIAILGMLAFGIISIGWIIDLFYEIYMLSESGRSPVANGIGVYVAFMGVFVHLLQLVLEYLAHAEG